MVVAHSFSRDEEADGSETVRHDDDKQRQLLSAAADAAVKQSWRGAGSGMEMVVFVAAAIGEQTLFGVLVEKAAETIYSETNYSTITQKRYL